MHSTVKRDVVYWLSSTVYAVGRWVYSTSIIGFILANIFGYQSKVIKFFHYNNYQSNIYFFRHAHKVFLGQIFCSHQQIRVRNLSVESIGCDNFMWIFRYQSIFTSRHYFHADISRNSYHLSAGCTICSVI
jgi:hypothetical protein